MNSASVIIVTDSRCGESAAFRDLEAFRQAMLACGWTTEEFENFLERDDADVHDADFAFPCEGAGIYVYENRGQYIYYTVFEDGTVKYRGAFDAPVHAATELD